MTTTEKKPTLQEFFREKRAATKAARAEAAAAPPRHGARRYKRKPKPRRRVDALDSIPLLAGSPARFVAVDRGLPPPPDSLRDPSPDLVVQTRSRTAVRGVAAILRRFTKLGIAFELAPDGSLVARSEAGAMPHELRDALTLAAPLLTPYLAGTPLACAWCPEDAVTLLFPGRAPACAEHAELPDDGAKVQYGRETPDARERLRRLAARLREGH